MSRGRLGLSHRSPWPYTFKLNGVGLMGGTKTRQSNEYVAYSPQDQAQAAPSSFGYGADNPAFGAVTAYAQMRLGMGLRVQRNQNAADDEQYPYMLGIDASVYPWVVGPEITTFTPAVTDATNGVVKFVKYDAGTLFAITGRYALTRISDSSWPVAKDFGSGKVATDAVAFYSNAHAAPYALVAMGDSEKFWYMDGSATWTQHATLFARAFGIAARELYRAHAINNIAKVDLDTDWTDAANWGNDYAFDLGDQSAGIVRLPTTADGILLPIKEDGVYTIQGVNDGNPGYDRKLQDFVPHADNGKPVARWGNELYVGSTYSGFWRYAPESLERKQVGPELLVSGSDVVAGYVTACEGTQFALYGAFWNPATSRSYVCKYVGLATIDGVDHPIWHGSLSDAYTSKITAMAADTIGADAGRVRLYLGFANGAIGWFQLHATPHPADDADYAFRTTDATGRSPRWHGGFPANEKALEAITVTAENFDADRAASVAYRTDPTGSFTDMADPFDTGTREKVGFAIGLSATNLDLELTLANADSSDSPRITGIGIHHHLHTPYRQIFQIRVLADDGLVRRDGTPLRIGRDRIKDVIETAADIAGGVTLVLPDGSSRQVHIRAPSQEVAYDGPRGAKRAFVLECVEITTNQTTGTHDRLEALGSHDAMENYTHAQLETV